MEKPLNLQIIYADNSIDAQYMKIMEDGLNEQAKVKKGLDVIKSFSFTCFDNDKNFVAGVDGKIFYGCLYVDMLWVSENFRGQNYGTLLMAKVEDVARERNCKFMTVCTTDWQAKPFYEKLGFKLEFVRSGYDKDSEVYYLRKDL
ncbi:MAG: GNAT family N-acetyltransferase [Rickettsia endosymbiont of Culicoides impunctatus]|uniref:GNAT family N-acetyltransferase n=1 Tax=Candidatus Tisiphia endosymbiont of Sialis lutaria TaxID=2029164 RepID=UPI001E70B9F8|nr:MAG: GNAT family N-acetyltransferase [Rickettsia endosymbiont of Culicoides impunctatus]